MVMLSPSPTPTAHGGRLVTPDGRALPLAQVHLAVEAGGGIARTVLTQRFENPYDEPLEVRYLLPLPADGAVSGFAFLLGERRVVGEVTDRRAARERFERALATGRTAALLEQDRSSLFTQQVGNLPPRTAVTAEVTVDQPLRWLEEGAWEWRFPTVVTPRYQGALGRVQDALKLRVPVRADAPLEVRASLALAVADRLTGAVASPSHGLRVREGDLGAEVELERSARLDRDLVITWPVALPDVSASVLAARPATAAHDGDTFALLTVAPPTGGGVALPRDLTVLIDTSGSMSGQPLSQAKRVVSALIETLGIEDRLELIEFSNAPTRWKPEPTVASETHKRDALRWVKTLRAGGCTEMHEAVLEALRPLRADSQRQVVLVTDGAIGFEQEIVRAVLEDLPGQARVHTVGVGSGINRTLTRGAARAGRGVELLLGAHENPDAAVGRLIARTAAPLVTELRLEGAEVLGVAPRGLPDLYAESPALIAVRCRAGAREVVLRGRTAEGDFEARLALPALARGEGPAGVVALYARELVEDLEASLSGGGQARELNPAIEATGVAFQIATRLTSWVAVSAEPTVDPRAQRRQVEQPHELPHGTSAEGLGLREGRSAQGEDDPFRRVGMERVQDLNLPKTNDLPWPRATEASSILDAPEELAADEELGVPPLDAQLLDPAADEPLVTEAFELMQESGEEDVDAEVVVFDTGRRVEVPFPRSLTMNAASPVMNPEQAEALRAVREGRATFGGPSRAKPKRWRRRLLLLAALAALAALVGWVIWSSAGATPR